MGCGASKTQTNNVVESHENAKPKSPEKTRTQSPTPTPTAPTETPAPSTEPASTPVAPTPTTNTVPTQSSPNPRNTTASNDAVRKSATNPLPPQSNPIVPTEPPKDTTSKPRTPPPVTSSLPPRAFPKKGEVIDIDLGVPSKVPNAIPRTAVQERLEKYAEERKVAALSRPTTANLERRLADAEERRKAQTEQKLKKVKTKNQDVEERGSQLKELEDKKAQELMLLIKNKNSQAAQKRQAIQKEAKQRAEEEEAKAKEVVARKTASASQTPVDTPHDTSSVDSEDSKKSILDTPLPSLATGAH